VYNYRYTANCENTVRVGECLGFRRACTSGHTHGVCVPSAVTIARLDTHCPCVPSAVISTSAVMPEDTNKNNTPWDRISE